MGLAALLVAAWLGVGHTARQPGARLWVDAASGQAAEDGSTAFPFKSITKALDAAGPGDVIRVKAGECRENILLSDGLTLIGEGLPVFRAADTSKPVIILRGRTVLNRRTGSGS
jgi:hypothetical protein